MSIAIFYYLSILLTVIQDVLASVIQYSVPVPEDIPHDATVYLLIHSSLFLFQNKILVTVPSDVLVSIPKPFSVSVPPNDLSWSFKSLHYLSLMTSQSLILSISVFALMVILVSAHQDIPVSVPFTFVLNSSFFFLSVSVAPAIVSLSHFALSML